jgi:hypothetical protein
VKVVLIGGPEDGAEYENESFSPVIFIAMYEPVTFQEHTEPTEINSAFKKGAYEVRYYFGSPSMDDQGRLQYFWKGEV